MEPWLAALLIAAGFSLLGVIWHQLNEKIREHKDDCAKDIEKLWDQVGKDSFSGMRKKVHDSVPMGAHVDLERRVDKLEGP